MKYLKYLIVLALAILGIMYLFFPELTGNQNAFNATICFLLASLYLDYEWKEK